MAATPEMWERLKEEYPIGSSHSLKVLRHEPFGIFVDVGYSDKYGFRMTGLIERFCTEKGKGLPMNQNDWPNPGELIPVKVISFRDYNYEIDFFWEETNRNA